MARKKEPSSTKGKKSRNTSSTKEDIARSTELQLQIYSALRVADDELLDLYKSNSAFRKIIDTGEYVRVDGVFVLRPFAAYLKSHNIPLIDVLSGSVDLSEQGFTSIIQNYCLWQFRPYSIETYPVYKRGIAGRKRPRSWGEVKKKSGHGKSYRPVLRKPRGPDWEKWLDIWSIKKGTTPPNVVCVHDGRVSKQLEPANFQGAHDSLAPSCLKEFLDSGGGNGDIPSLSELLTQHMSREKLTDEKMEELTGISERTIRGIRNDEDRRPLLRNVIAICIALKLNGDAARKMVRAAGYALRNTAEENAFSYLLQYGSSFSVLASNDFLKSMGYPPLTSLCSSEDEDEK